MERKCKKCNKLKDLECFCKNKNCKFGYEYICKECNNIYRKNKIEKDPLYYKKMYIRKKEYNVQYNKNNKDKIRKQERIYCKKHPRGLLGKEYNVKYYINNRDDIIKRYKNYYKNNKELFFLYSSRRRALKKTTEDGTINKKSAQKLLKYQNYKCKRCGCNLNRFKKHLDHIIPLSKGGIHSIFNIQYLCSSCNRKKGAKLEGQLPLFG